MPPRLAPPAVVAAGVPTPLTTFIGREHEVATVCALLRREDVRLLTLIGPGGVGKTRLALEATARLADHPSASSGQAPSRGSELAPTAGRGQAFADGIAFVSLASIRDPALVASAIAQVLGVREHPDRPLVDALTAYLRPRAMLLALDNLEHLLAAAPLVANLLAACSELAILATSRSTLHVYGERDLLVPPLPLPDPARLPPVDRLARNEAIRLFVERAQAADAAFKLTTDNAPAVATICQRLDGLPLAIELAAARVAVLPPATLLARLEPCLPLLTGGARDQPVRLQTMRDALAWSYDLLGPDAQALFRRLAVFVGGFTLDAAEWAMAESPSPPSVLDGVSSLVDNSLLLRREGAEGEARFLMLETIREYGLERLEASGEAEAVRRCHASFFLALGEDLAARLSGAETVAALDRLSAALGTVRAALAWALERGEAETALRLAGALVSFWNFRGHLAEGRRWLAAALAAGGTSPTTRADALFAATVLAVLQGDHAQADAYAEESLALSREHDHAFGISRALFILGASAEWQGDLDRAASLCEAAIPPMRAVGHPRWLGQALAFLASVTHLRGDLARAETLAGEGLEEARKAGHDWVTAIALGVLANIACERGDLERAHRLYEEILALYRPLGDQRGIAGTLGGLGGVALARGQPERAARLLGAARALGDSIGVVHLAYHVYYQRVVSATRARLDDSAFTAAWEAGRALSPEQALAEERAIIDEADVPTPAADVGLTPREVEVLRLVADGRSDRGIAAALSISSRTAGNHVASVLDKLGVGSRAAAVALAMRRGWI